jgi:hypothetical protein
MKIENSAASFPARTGSCPASPDGGPPLARHRPETRPGATASVPLTGLVCTPGRNGTASSSVLHMR